MLQVGPYQVHDYDTQWVGLALSRAAAAADRSDFPFLEEIRQATDEYLDSYCSLELLPLHALFARLRRLLEQVGCQAIASHLTPLAPPLTIDLGELAGRVDPGFELLFFETLRRELRELAAAGANELFFVGLAECVRRLRGTDRWGSDCDELEAEIRAFLHQSESRARGDACLKIGD